MSAVAMKVKAGLVARCVRALVTEQVVCACLVYTALVTLQSHDMGDNDTS